MIAITLAAKAAARPRAFHAISVTMPSHDSRRLQRKNETGGNASAQPAAQTVVDSKVADYWDEHTDESFHGETY